MENKITLLPKNRTLSEEQFEEKETHSPDNLLTGMNESLSKAKAAPFMKPDIKSMLMSPSMVQGLVSPLQTITQTRPQTLERMNKASKKFSISNTSKPFVLSPVVKLDHNDEEDRRSLKDKKNEEIEDMLAGFDEDYEINEELLLTQHMSELSIVEDSSQEWYTLIGILILLLTIFG